MTANENIRINRVLKDFNIGMGTLIDFLKSKKIEIKCVFNKEEEKGYEK